MTRASDPSGHRGTLRVLTWNLFHGRSVPDVGRDLFEPFARLLAGWEWDVALLQEVPPWWPSPLGRRCGAEQASALTSRNLGLRLRRALAKRRPDLMKSNGGGCNAVLVRGRIAEAHALRLRLYPERRVAQLVRTGGGSSFVNYHGSARAALAREELDELARRVEQWRPDGPLVLGGDLNLRDPRPGSAGFEHVASRDVDHLFARGMCPTAPAARLDRRVGLDGQPVELSDHIPLAVSLRPAATGAVVGSGQTLGSGVGSGS